MNHIVKTRGHKEQFHPEKIFSTCHRACLNAQLEDKEAERISHEVEKGVTAWIRNKKEVSSDEIFRLVIKLMAEQSKEAAFMYETHRDLS